MDNQFFNVLWMGLKPLIDRFDRELGPNKSGICILKDPGAHEVLLSQLHFQRPSHWILSATPIKKISGGQRKVISIVKYTGAGEGSELPVKEVYSTDVVESVPRTIMHVLHKNNADHFVDIFNAQVVSYLRTILVQYGVRALIEEIFKIVQLCGIDGEELDLEALEADRRASALSHAYFKPKSDGDQMGHLRAFFDGLTTSPEPHVYLKARFSYHVYLRSNRNASKASRKLNISRTTLHDHLRLAERFGLVDEPK